SVLSNHGDGMCRQYVSTMTVIARWLPKSRLRPPDLSDAMIFRLVKPINLGCHKSVMNVSPCCSAPIPKFALRRICGDPSLLLWGL
mgnify:CR=1